MSVELNYESLNYYMMAIFGILVKGGMVTEDEVVELMKRAPEAK